MRAETLPGVGGWESAVSPPCRAGSQAKGFKEIEVDNISLLPRVKAMLSCITDSRRWLRTLCAVCVEKKLPRPVFLYFHYYNCTIIFR